MRIVDCLTPLLGSWHGTNRVRMLPTDDYQRSDATATARVTAGGFVTIAYTWSHDGTPQDGLLLLGDAQPGTGETGAATAVWVDSWHTGPGWMTFSGPVGVDGLVRLAGTYPAPQGPDWGWQIHIDPGDGATGRMTMHNLVPGEAAYQVVELVLDRRG